ncbi:MAG TPA: hypothetical protein VK668_18620 [Mucilaginibacter sp.]|nr:hypothetical protein [Mucilaginibacter sp.]
MGVSPIFIGAGLFTHTAQALAAMPVSVPIPNAKKEKGCHPEPVEGRA